MGAISLVLLLTDFCKCRDGHFTQNTYNDMRNLQSQLCLPAAMQHYTTPGQTSYTVLKVNGAFQSKTRKTMPPAAVPLQSQRLIVIDLDNFF